MLIRLLGKLDFLERRFPNRLGPNGVRRSFGNEPDKHGINYNYPRDMKLRA